jgi:uncharacterized protein with HEPN domain
VLREALAHFEVVADYGRGEVIDQKTVDAICMRLSAGIEALAALDPAVREDLFGDAWFEMWGMRNRIAHGYLLVEPGIVHSTVERDVPTLIATIRQAMQRLT